MSGGRRLDAILVERGLAETRSRAQAMILAGRVRVGDRVVTKAGFRPAPGEEVSLAVPERSYVSRAGEKLEAALERFGVEVEGRLCLDAGASTGGFTDVLLRRGARRVVAVDVGYGQLDWRLRRDPRVEVMERTNVRHLGAGDLPFAPELVVADLSFISVVLALYRLFRTAGSVREAVVLVKPQFEVGPEKVSRGGVVRDPEVRAEAVLRAVEGFGRLGFGAVGVMESPVFGRRSGNREYLLHLLRGEETRVGPREVREALGGGVP
ncbi:16S/23S rRNA (cytidine-2'-O)-methyltransferase TlyA [Rubrobacter xylanophilus DSM 9941]|uniref:TlyA family RNA methyltransferase n=1 Tax=Rubrobacter xylanophilus TaxID=49319 RepID=UPI001C642FD6|nr:TlyA family RNA methyltransferase [Rubrobacter xylanophilus]QYJ14690.1 16S/23S rRNA (cytidine-2'-O)-methyltransferase TlyA [Rubrobacter xylanophilus DSM 9941]